MMYYILYLTSLCRRRHWPEPTYNSYPNPNPSGTGAGYTCVVRVNNREYQTDTVYASETLARESAAMRAYLICRNFSVNDGMYPAGHDHGGVVQGIPVAIGTGRKIGHGLGREFDHVHGHGHDHDDIDGSRSGSSGGGSICGSRSGGSSPVRVGEMR